MERKNFGKGSEQMSNEEAQNEANKLRVLAAEYNPGAEKHVYTAEEYENALKDLECLLRGLKDEKSALGVIGKYSVKIAKRVKTRHYDDLQRTLTR